MDSSRLMFILFAAAIQMASSDDASLSTLLQQNPALASFLADNKQIYQLLSSNPELVRQFSINPNLAKQTVDHAKFLNSFLQEHANLPQIIKDNPSVYAFILKQVDHAVETGEDKTIVLQMTEADIKEAQKELQEAAQAHFSMGTNGQIQSQVTGEQIKVNGQAEKGVSSGVFGQQKAVSDQTNIKGQNIGLTVEANGQSDPLDGLTREQILVLLAKYQAGQQSLQTLTQTLSKNQQLNGNHLFQTEFLQQSNPNSGSSLGSQSLTGNGFGSNGQMGSNNGFSMGGPSRMTGDIDFTKLKDLNRLKDLYSAMYNMNPKRVEDLHDFYNIVLARLNVRTRKDVDDFLARFKSSQSSGVLPSQGGSFGYSTSNGYSNGFSGSSTVQRPSWFERMRPCKRRKFCRRNPNSPLCTAQVFDN